MARPVRETHWQPTRGDVRLASSSRWLGVCLVCSAVMQRIHRSLTLSTPGNPASFHPSVRTVGRPATLASVPGVCKFRVTSWAMSALAEPARPTRRRFGVTSANVRRRLRRQVCIRASSSGLRGARLMSTRHVHVWTSPRVAIVTSHSTMRLDAPSRTVRPLDSTGILRWFLRTSSFRPGWRICRSRLTGAVLPGHTALNSRGFRDFELWKVGVMPGNTTRRYPPELQELADRMVAEITSEQESEWVAMSLVAELLGVGTAETVRKRGAWPWLMPERGQGRSQRNSRWFDGPSGRSPS